MKPETAILPRPPVGTGFQSRQVTGSLEAFSAFGVSGWAVAKDPSAGRLAIHIVTAKSYDVCEVSRPRPDVVMHGYDSLYSGFTAPMENWLALGLAATAGPQHVTMIVMQGDVPCYRVNFMVPTGDLLVPTFQFNIESGERTHLSGWIASADTLAPLALWAVNEAGEERFIPADILRDDLLTVGPTARAFWHQLPLSFTLRQSMLRLCAEQRGRHFPVRDIQLPDVVAFLERHVEEMIAAGGKPDVLRGWAVNLRTPGRRPRVALRSGATTLWSGRATMYRRDISEQTGMDGFSAFAVPFAMIPPGAPWSIWVGDGADERRLAGSGEG